MIELEHITKIYSAGDINVTALNDVSFRCEDGEMVSIMGASGSGKSTLMNLIGCLDSPTTGVYRLDGQDVSQMADKMLAKVRNGKIGFVFQSFNLLPRITALANVELPMVYARSKNKRKHALQVLEAVGISGRAKHRPSELSGGEQQRVAIARALVLSPSIILADEPTGNLDTNTSHSIMSLLQEQHEKGITVIIVTHEEDVANYTQRTIYLRDGEIVEEKRR
jgi:putative ABC transport system ATP-binding protein